MPILEFPEEQPAALFVAGMEEQLKKATDEDSFLAMRAQGMREARKMYDPDIVAEINDGLSDRFVERKNLI